MFELTVHNLDYLKAEMAYRHRQPSVDYDALPARTRRFRHTRRKNGQ